MHMTKPLITRKLGKKTIKTLIKNNLKKFCSYFFMETTTN